MSEQLTIESLQQEIKQLKAQIEVHQKLLSVLSMSLYVARVLPNGHLQDKTEQSIKQTPSIAEQQLMLAELKKIFE
ncbi:hypothetical protein [Mannheimia massilioguelmaensis]|uniref:hypothetical protein n=1 Tax=Mannheimia massilioguelmaensis TaxID=1604354 RepID=UPI0005C8F045|nr:hypothetical protein [Mannheimia massilioguelmaensis]